MLALVFWLSMGCGDDSTAVGEEGFDGWSEGLWSGQALTIRAGLEEAILLTESGERERAAELALQVYRGSFEPELEPAIREVLGVRATTQMEFRFGLVVDSLRRGKEGVSTVADLLEGLDEAAARLDEQRVEIH
jgi:hypothetical protein